MASRATLKIPTYFSHSYRPEDRAINCHLWDLLWEHGFLVQVDPQSEDKVAGVFSIPYLEIMMRQSACFVSALTYREEEEFSKCSPYMLWEYGLAVQARKPRLILVEQRVAGRYFQRGDPSIQIFDRKQIKSLTRQVTNKLKALAKHARLTYDMEAQLRGPVGIALGKDGDGILDDITMLVRRAGHEPLIVSRDFAQNFEFALTLDRLSFMIVDVTPGALPDWVYPYIHGRFIPAVRLFRINDGDSYQGLPKLIAGQIIRGAATESDTVLFWRNKRELVSKLRMQLSKVDIGRKAFDDYDDGRRYFTGLGLQKRRIFISNAASSNKLAALVAKALVSRNLETFQYRESNLIESGSDWRKELRRLVSACDMFIALLTKDYFTSQFCAEEIETASGRHQNRELSFLSYLLEAEVQHKLQARVLLDKSLEEQCKAIIADVEKLLIGTSAPDDRQFKDSLSRSGGKADIGIVTIIDEEYRAISNVLGNVTRADLPSHRTDTHGWQVGELRSPDYREPYLIVFGKAQRPTNAGAVNIVRELIDLWAPRYVVLVGIAGGVGSEDSEVAAKGDVVISNVIYGYEYGKLLDGTFVPRPDFTFHVDGGLLAGAELLPIRHPDWAVALADRLENSKKAPAVIVGPVASGDKVVDDASTDFFETVLRFYPRVRAVEMEGAGVAQAIEAARASGHAVGFIMIRGISDVPNRKRRGKVGGGLDRPSAERQYWKRMAAETAAEFAAQLIRFSWPERPRSLSKK